VRAPVAPAAAVIAHITHMLRMLPPSRTTNAAASVYDRPVQRS
jgi:hypothetical protein